MSLPESAHFLNVHFMDFIPVRCFDGGMLTILLALH